MINRIKELFSPTATVKPDVGHADVALNAAALLVVAALQDASFGPEERAHIETLITRRFDLAPDEVRELIAEAEVRVVESAQILPFTRAIKDHFSHDSRIEMVEMLWEVVYADGVLHDHEAALMRRIGGLIYVSDRERGEARKRALSKLKVAAKPA
jgi:uncharacterized tellurite resistance protein B-like protein